MQETGKKGASASKLAKFPFNEKLSKYREFPEDVQNALLDLEFAVWRFFLRKVLAPSRLANSLVFPVAQQLVLVWRTSPWSHF